MKVSAVHLQYFVGYQFSKDYNIYFNYVIYVLKQTTITVWWSADKIVVMVQYSQWIFVHIISYDSLILFQ